MYYFNVNVNGEWKKCKLSKDEVRALKAATASASFAAFEILADVAKKKNFNPTESAMHTAVFVEIFRKLAPTYECLATDYACERLLSAAQNKEKTPVAA